MSIEKPILKFHHRHNRDDRALAHIPALDGLRGTAIIMVILCHGNLSFSGRVATDIISHIYNRLTSTGWIGVDLFFVLSGFLITGILLRSRDNPHYFRNFYARRFLRIVPLYYLFAIFCFLVAPHFNVSSTTAAEKSSILFYYYNFWVIHSGHRVGTMHVFWSLCVEEHFYLVWPFLVRWLSDKHLARLCILGIAGSLLLRVTLIYIMPSISHTQPKMVEAYLLTPCRLDGLCIGSWLAISHRHAGLWKAISHRAPTVVLFSATLAAGIAIWSRHFVDNVAVAIPPAHSSALVLTLGISAITVFCGSILACSLTEGNLALVLEHRSLRVFGKYSYGMYIFHTFALYSIGWLFRRFAPFHYTWTAKLFGTALGVALTFAIAFLSYNLYEKNFLKLKRFFPECQPWEDRFIAALSRFPGSSFINS